MPTWGRFPLRRVEGISIVRLPLSPVEAFVLCQLDGASDLRELASHTSLSEGAVERALNRLFELGAITGETPKPEPRIEQPIRQRARDPRRDDDDDDASPREEHFTPRPRREAAAPSVPPPVSAPVESTPDEPDVQIDEARRRLIDETFVKLDSLTHYQLLQVGAKATKKEIKAAYFPLISVFHPDRYFGKRLGGYKRRLERIFEQLTQAYTVLTREKTRAEYDKYLTDRQRTRSYDAVLSSIPPPPPPSQPTIQAATPAAPAETVIRVPATPAASPHSMKRLARRLGPPAPTKRSEPPPAAPAISARVEQDLKRLLSARETKRDATVEKFVKAGAEALESKQNVSAVNALRIALSLAPDDAEVRVLYENAERQAATELAQSYEARAEYEERNHNWEQAARSYQLVARGKPNRPEPLDKAAECLLLTGTDPRRAVELARQAVLLAPKAVGYRSTLAKAYEAAGLFSSALGEVKRALELRPGDPELKEWAARLGRVER